MTVHLPRFPIPIPLRRYDIENPGYSDFRALNLLLNTRTLRERDAAAYVRRFPRALRDDLRDAGGEVEG